MKLDFAGGATLANICGDGRPAILPALCNFQLGGSLKATNNFTPSCSSTTNGFREQRAGRAQQELNVSNTCHSKLRLCKEDHNFANPKKHLPGGKWTPWRDSDSVRMPRDFRPQYLKKISLL